MITKTDARDIVLNSGVANWDWGTDSEGNLRDPEQILELLTDYVYDNDQFTDSLSDKLLSGFVANILGDDPEEYNLHTPDYYDDEYFIENSSGQYWTGECWGVMLAAQNYREDDLPDEVDGYKVLDATLPIEDRLYLNPDDPDEVDGCSIVRGFSR